MAKKKKFVIVDAMALAYKAYFAFITRPLINSKGVATSAVYGFINQIFKIIEDTKPDYMAVASDSKEKTFRHEIYEGYKATREDMPEDMVPQLAMIKEVIEKFNFPLYIYDGYEADDLIGTAVRQAEKEGLESYAITPDKDYVQLITKNTKLVKPGKSTDQIDVWDVEKVKDEYGFEPGQMIDFLALVGDSSDDIPGVAGVGPLTALPLIEKYGSIENLYENIDEIDKKGLKNKLIEGKDNAFLSKKLATIKTDVDFKIDFEAAKFTKPDLNGLLKLFAELEFKSFADKLRKIFAETEAAADAIDETALSDKDSFDTKKVKYTLITSKKEAELLAQKLEKSGEFVFDTETDGLNVFEIKLAGCAFCIKEGEAYYVATNPNVEGTELFETDLSDRLPVDDFVNIFKKVFEKKTVKKICQNGKYDIAVLRTYGIELQGFYFDTMLASYVIDPDQKHGMDDLSETYLKYTPIPITELIGSKKTPEKIFEADINKLCDYSCEDADITYRLYKILSGLIDENGLKKVAFEIEFPLVEILEDMERTGVSINKDALYEMSLELEKLLDKYTAQIHKLAGNDFNINSTQQLQKILFEKLDLPKTKKTKTGYSTDARSLESLQGKHEIVDEILNYRQAAKLKSTYVDALPKLVNEKTNRIHTTFNQTVASTGRLSSIDPNLQNIPIRTELGKEIRKAFVPSGKDYVILSADYSQIELRIMAHICGDEGLLSAFKNGEDIHRSTAARVFMVDPDDVTPDMRRKAKEVNFGILYGIGAFGLKNRLGITQKHAQEVIDTYFNTFKKVKEYMENSVKSAQEKGFAETLTGRRRFLRNINSSNRTVRQFEERVAINMPVQGTAADMIKYAMIKIYHEMKKMKLKSRMVLQVHDELLFDAHKDELDELRPQIKEWMENAMKLDVPIIVETGVGDNWLDAH